MSCRILRPNQCTFSESDTEAKEVVSALKGVIKASGINCEGEQGLYDRYSVHGHTTDNIFAMSKWPWDSG